MPRKRGQLAAVGKPLTCERELKNAVGTYCGNKDDLSDAEWKVATP